MATKGARLACCSFDIMRPKTVYGLAHAKRLLGHKNGTRLAEGLCTKVKPHFYADRYGNEFGSLSNKEETQPKQSRHQGAGKYLPKEI